MRETIIQITKKMYMKFTCLVIAAVMVLFCIQIPAVASPPSFEGNLDCKSAILIEASTGMVIYEKNADTALPPASVTKVMTLLLVMEAIEEGKIKYDDKVRASKNACSMGGSQIYLKENEEMSVLDLLKSVIISSANDAAVALAEHLEGSEESFVSKMNAKAKEFNMKNTTFENTNGLDDTVEKHLTSARDIAIMSRELIKYPKITELSSIWMDTVRNGSFGLTNTNRLIRFYKGATGLKTGSTSKAGFCISATATRDGMTLICVIMGAPSRDVRNATAVTLLDFGFANYSLYSAQGEKINNIPIVKGTDEVLEAEYGDFCAVVPKGEKDKIKKTIDLPESVSAPIEKGCTIGNIIYTIDDKEIGRTEIRSTQNVKKIRFGNFMLNFLKMCANIV